MRPGDSEAIDYDAVLRIESTFHTGANDVVTAEDKGVKKDSPKNNSRDKDNHTQQIFCCWVTIKHRRCFVHMAILARFSGRINIWQSI